MLHAWTSISFCETSRVLELIPRVNPKTSAEMHPAMNDNNNLVIKIMVVYYCDSVVISNLIGELRFSKQVGPHSKGIDKSVRVNFVEYRNTRQPTNHPGRDRAATKSHSVERPITKLL